MDYPSIVKPPQSESLKSGKVVFGAGESVGWHVTEKKEELLVVIRGNATVLVESGRSGVQAGKAFFIPEGKKHNVLNEGKGELEYYYVTAATEWPGWLVKIEGSRTFPLIAIQKSFAPLCFAISCNVSVISTVWEFVSRKIPELLSTALLGPDGFGLNTLYRGSTVKK
ncbi:MAG: cupin domain-containing protein [archaeon]